MNLGRSKKMLFVASFAFLATACSKDKEKQFEAGAEHQLYKKEIFSQSPVTFATANEQIKPFLSAAGYEKNATEVRFFIKRDYLYLLPLDSNISLFELQSVQGSTHQWRVKGHYDVSVKKTGSGEETAFLEKNDKNQANWQDRSHMEVDANDALQVVLPAEQKVNLYRLSDLNDLSGTLQTFATKDFVVEELASAALDRILSASPKKQKMDKNKLEVRSALAKDYLHLFAVVDGVEQEIYRVPVSYVDTFRKEDSYGQPLAALGLRTDTMYWEKAQWVKVDIANAQATVEGERVVSKKGLHDSCFATAEDIPVELSKPQQKKINAELGATKCAKVRVQQNYLDFYAAEASARFSAGQDRFIGQVQVARHTDFLTQANTSGQIQSWKNRPYVVVAKNSFKSPTMAVGKNALSTDFLDGQYLYTVTTIASHDNIPASAATGRQTTYGSILKFKRSSDYLLVYKVDDLQNTSSYRDLSPVARFPARFFDIERHALANGDEGFEYVENDNCELEKCGYVRVQFANNQVPNYFATPTGILKLLGPSFSGYMVSEARQVGEVELEASLLSFDTEEVLIPGPDSSATTESGYEPVSAVFRHAFMRIDPSEHFLARPYDALDFEKFGFFTTEVLGLNEANQATDDARKQYANIFDIRDGKDIVFHISRDFPEHLVPLVEKSIDIWNESFELATGRNKIVSLVKNSKVRKGDPRYSRIQFVDSRAGGLLGYGPSVVNPTNGKVYSSVTYLYRATEESARRQAGKIYDYLKNPTKIKVKSAVPTKFKGIREKTAPLNFLRVESSSFEKIEMHSSDFQWNPTLGRGSLALAENYQNAVERLQALPANVSALASRDSRSFEQFSFLEDADTNILNHSCADREFSVAAGLKLFESKPNITRDAFIKRAVEGYVVNTLVHEIGHNLGLRHNFLASTDRENFTPTYKKYDRLVSAQMEKVQELSAMGSDSVFAEMQTLNKLISTRDRFRTSSYMDYLKLFEGDISEPAPYDVAALKYAYTGKLAAKSGEDISRDTYRRKLDTMLATYSVKEASQLIDQAEGVKKFMFCTDEHVEGDPACNRHDSGLSMTEILKESIEEYHSRYRLYVNRDGKRSFRAMNSGTRTINLARQVFAELLYKSQTGGFASAQVEDQAQPFDQDDYFKAAQMGLQFLLDIVRTPEPGIYSRYPNSNIFVPGAQPNQQKLIVDLDAGKFLMPEWESFGSEDLPMRKGIVLDKINAFNALALQGFPAGKYERVSLLDSYAQVPEFSREIVQTLSKVFNNQLMSPIGLKPLTADSKKGGDLLAQPATAKKVDGLVYVPMPLWMQTRGLINLAMHFNGSGSTVFDVYSDFRSSKKSNIDFEDDIKLIEFTNTAGTVKYAVPQTKDGLSIAYEVAGRAGQAHQELAALEPAAAELDASVLADAQVLVRDLATFMKQNPKVGSNTPLVSIHGSLMQVIKGIKDGVADRALLNQILTQALPFIRSQLMEIDPATLQTVPTEEQVVADPTTDVVVSEQDINTEFEGEAIAEEEVKPVNLGELTALVQDLLEMSMQETAVLQKLDQNQAVIDETERKLLDMEMVRELFAM